jgi:DNA-binding CsgD family transcriptional regulator
MHVNPTLLRKAANSFVNAAFDPALWPTVLEKFANAAGAAGVVLLPIKGRVPGVPLSDSVGEMIESYFRHGWHVHDQRELGIAKMLRTGVMVDQDFATPEMMKAAPFYQELLIPHNLQWFAGIAFSADDEIWCAAIQRTPAQGPFSASEQTKLLAVRNSLTAAATLARRFGLARIEGLSSAFELRDAALIFVDRRGRPVIANARAKEFIRDVLHVVNGEFSLTNNRDQSALRKQIAVALDGLRNAEAPHQLPVIVAREGLSPLVLQIVTVPRDMLGNFAPAVCMILVTDPEDRFVLREDVLAAVFALTPAESGLASRVASGMSLEGFARRYGLADSTVRTMMKRILAKSDTHRQGEFIALANRILTNAPQRRSGKP